MSFKNFLFHVSAQILTFFTLSILIFLLLYFIYLFMVFLKYLKDDLDCVYSAFCAFFPFFVFSFLYRRHAACLSYVFSHEYQVVHQLKHLEQYYYHTYASYLFFCAFGLVLNWVYDIFQEAKIVCKRVNFNQIFTEIPKALIIVLCIMNLRVHLDEDEIQQVVQNLMQVILFHKSEASR